MRYLAYETSFSYGLGMTDKVNYRALLITPMSALSGVINTALLPCYRGTQMLLYITKANH